MVDWGLILQTILMVIINVALPVVLVAVIKWVRLKIDEVKSKIDTQTLSIVNTLAMQLVLAAEQSGLKDQLLQEGAAKKEWVIAQLSQSLAEKGIHMDIQALSNAIEAAVYEAFKQSKPSGEVG